VQETIAPQGANVEAEIDALSRQYPGWTPFVEAGVWCARGTCHCDHGPHERTWHAPDPVGLRRQLAAAGRGSDARP
jgi:hypothetical protein